VKHCPPAKAGVLNIWTSQVHRWIYRLAMIISLILALQDVMIDSMLGLAMTLLK